MIFSLDETFLKGSIKFLKMTATMVNQRKKSLGFEPAKTANGTRTHSHLVRKRTLNHLDKLAK